MKLIVIFRAIQGNLLADAPSDTLQISGNNTFPSAYPAFSLAASAIVPSCTPRTRPGLTSLERILQDDPIPYSK